MAFTLEISLLVIVYADDIILLSCSYSGLQKMVDICANYGVHWDIKLS